MGRTYRQDKEWGNPRSQKKKKGRTKEQPYINSKNPAHKEGIYYEDLEVEAYEKDLKNQKRNRND